MSFVFGGRPGRQDPELAKAAARRREAFARDIGDEYGRAFAHEPPRQRRRWTSIVGLVLILFAGLGAIPLLRGSGGGLIERQCDHPAIGVSAGVISPGDQAAWQVAGPSGDYVVAVDSDGVAMAGGVLAAKAGRVLAGPFQLADCRSAQTLFDAPADPGTHEIRLYQRSAQTGKYTAVADAGLKVG